MFCTDAFYFTKYIFFVYNLNQQSEFTIYKLMLWLLQCDDGEWSSGESPVFQIKSIGQFLLSRLFCSLTSSVLRSGFSWVSSVVWCLLHFWWMAYCTYDIPTSACSVALETYHGASTIIVRILDWLLWIIDILDLLAQPQIWMLCAWFSNLSYRILLKTLSVCGFPLYNITTSSKLVIWRIYIHIIYT
jgi:hypothetical protein